jgi:signal transduction protein with GAF and PtsI domain
LNINSASALPWKLQLKDDMKKSGLIEKIENHPVVQAGVTLISSYHPAAGILPTLLSSAANTRMEKRIEEAIEDLERQVSSIQEQVATMNDAQYKLVCETLSHLQRTNDPEKIEYLKRAVLNGVKANDLTSEKAYIISRIVRDVSAVEIDFIMAAAKYLRIRLEVPNQDGSIPITDQTTYTVAEGYANQTIIAGLRSLGLLKEDETWDSGYQLTPLAFALITLLHQ